MTDRTRDPACRTPRDKLTEDDLDKLAVDFLWIANLISGDPEDLDNPASQTPVDKTEAP